jgi:UDP-glucose 4-epimerase
LTRVLIIGGAGFIGTHLALDRIARGDDVHILVRPQTNLWRLAEILTKVKIHSLELRDPVALAECFAFSNPEEVYHLASQTRSQPSPDFSDASESIHVDVLNFTAVLAAASASKFLPKVLVRAGTLAEYGNGPVPFVESQREKPLNSYAAALTASTHCAQMLQSRLAFPVITARLALTYGPSQDDDFLIPSLVRNCLAGEPTSIARPDNRRDLIYVTDVIEALGRIAKSQLPGGTIVNIATGISHPMRDVGRMVAEITGVSSTLIKISEPPEAKDQIGDAPKDICGSPVLARKLLGWKAGINLTEGLQRMLERSKVGMQRARN